MTLAAPKTGLAEPGVAAAVGWLFLADISVPALVYERLGLRYETPFGQGPLLEIIGADIHSEPRGCISS